MRHETMVDYLIDAICPNPDLVRIRKEVVALMRIILIHSNTKDCLLFLSGSYPISCYLPEGDVDMVMITPIRSMSKENNGSNEAGLESDILTFELMQSIYKHATKEQRFVETAPIVTSCSAVDTIPNSLLPYAHLSIRNVEFVNARTKLVHCMVNNTSVDITMNQIGALLGVLLIEDVDKRVGHNHLFKRTLLLIKCWCYHESMKYSGVSILGSKFGFFSSYALAVMLMHVFNTSFSLDKDLTHMSHGIADCHADIGVEGVRRGSGKNESDSMNSSAKPVVATTSPFAVFHKFLEIFSQFQWNSHVLTVASGAVPIQFGTGHAGSGENSSENVPHIDHFRAIISKYQLMLEDYTTLVESGSKCNSTKDGSETRMRSPSFSSSASFTLRLCNVQDPLVCSNNLCLGVTATTLQLIEHTFRAGYYHLQQVMFNASNNKRNKRSHSMDRELGATAGQSQNPISIQEESVRVRSEKIPVAEDGESLQSIRETNFYSSDEESVCGVDEGNESEADSGVTVLRKTTSTATPLATTNLSHSPPSPPGRKRESKQSNTSLPPLPCAPWANASPNSTQKMLKEKLPKAQSQTSAPVMPSSRNTYILEEFFSRSCISYFGSFYKIPERNRPTLYQYIQKKFSKEHLSRHEGYKCFDGDADEIAAIIEYLKSPHITTVDVKGDRSTAGSSESTSELTCGFCSDTNPAPKVETVGVEGVACANAAHHKVELVNASCQTIETLPSMKYREPNPCPDGVASPVATSTMELTSVSISNRLEDDSDKILSTPTVCKQHIANKASVVTTPQMVQMEHGGIDESSFQTPSINGQEDHAQPQAQLQFLSFINAVLNYLGSIQIVKDSGFIIVDTVVYDRQQSKAVCSATHSSTSASKTRKRNRSHSNCHNHSQGGNPNVSSVKAGSAINIQRKRTLWPVVVVVFCLIIGGVMLFGKLLGVDATSFYAMWNGKSLSYFNRKPPAKLHGNQAEAAMNSRMAKSLFDNGGASHSLNSNPVGDESIAVGDNQDIDCFGVGQCQRAAPVVPDTGVGESGTRQKNKEKEEIALETVGDTTALLGSQAPSQGFPKEIPIRTECTPLYIPVVTHYVKIGQPISLSVDETDEQLLHYLLDVSDVNVDLSAVDSMDTQFGVSGRVPNGKLGQNLGVELDSNEDVWDFDVESLRGTDAASLDTESDFAFDMGNGDAFHGKDRVFKSLPSHPKESSSGLCDYSGHNKGMGVCQSVDSIRANVGGSKAKISDYFRFQWMRDSKVLHNATETSTYSVSRTTNGHAGVYSCYAIPKHVPNPRLKFTSSDNAGSGNNFISQLDSMNSAHGGYHSRYYKPPQQKYKIATTNIVISTTPNCSTKPLYIALESSKEIVISLECSGVPEPTYQWFKNGIKVPGQTRSSYVETLSEKSIVYASGTYSCELRNMAGLYNWMEATVG